VILAVARAFRNIPGTSRSWQVMMIADELTPFATAGDRWRG
jgi:hypothetical protein